MFVFIGGGVRKKEVEVAIRNGLGNIVSLPYQPLESLKYSLSAADIHVVSVGNEIVGICHPSKVYGAMAVSRPILLFGPRKCHVTELIDLYDIGWQVDHGDVARAVRIITETASSKSERAEKMGNRSLMAIKDDLSKERLCGRFMEVVEGQLN